MDTVGPS
jgi:transposase InsO family protein